MPEHDDAKADAKATGAVTPQDSGKAGGRPARSTPTFGAFVPSVRKASARESAPSAQVSAAAEGLRAETSASWPADAIEVGAVIEAYGLKGGLKIAPHAQGGKALLAAKRWWLLKGRERPEHYSAVRVSAKVHGDSVVAQLGGLTDRDAAVLLRGARIYVTRADFPVTEADEYYWVDLIDNGAQSVLRIEFPETGKDGKPTTGERLIPFVGVFVKTVDLAAKRIVVDWEADY